MSGRHIARRVLSTSAGREYGGSFNLSHIDAAAEIENLREQVQALEEDQHQAKLALANLNERLQRIEVGRAYISPPDKRESVRVKRLGGRPLKFDWEALWFEMVRIAQVDGFHSQRELREQAHEWIARSWPEEPSPSVLREKLRRLGVLLGLPEN
jgi:hypothetical protein